VILGPKRCGLMHDAVAVARIAVPPLAVGEEDDLVELGFALEQEFECQISVR